MNNADPEFDALQRTLRQFQPAPLSDPLLRTLADAARDRHAHDRPARSPRADRVLALWTASGALAACVVALLTAWQLTTVPHAAPASPQDLALRQQMVMEYEKVLALR
jgi:uncharacterized protein (DUF58 family)